ncbi:MAG: type VI secretion system tip protein VgrG [Deltaproteobacteria bacterium]|nr:type VI secretion system tip protein VgrG [Deltaproteobacteria bacterium]
MAFGPVSYEFTADNAPQQWRVRRFNFREKLSGIYHCHIDLVASELEADIDSLLGSSASITLARITGVERHVRGIIAKVRNAGALRGHVLVQIELVPALFALSQTSNSRIFQAMKAPDILEQVLSQALQPYQRSVKLDLQRSDYAEREYCVQYNEKDLDFVHRIMQEEGIYYYFDQSSEQEELVLTDSNDKLLECISVTGSSIDLIPADAGAPEKEVVQSFYAGTQLHSTSIILHEYDWKQPAQPAHHEASAQDNAQHDRIIYDSEPHICVSESGNDGAIRKQVRQEEFAALGKTGTGKGILIGFFAGSSFELVGHTQSELDCKYILVEVEHYGTVPDNWDGESNSETEYYNTFTVIPADVPFRPAHDTIRPTVGMLTATVVGPSGEEIHTDKDGRIKVQFHWDQDGQNDENSSCWIRVAQIWAGSGFGMLFIPRMGMEVVVQFVEGHPDRPLVTGCVYNGRNAPPIKLPDDKTKSGLVTRSSLEGTDGNELIFEDAKDNEEIYLQAQRDWNILVKNNQDETVRGDSSRTVEGNDDNTIKGNHTERIKGNDNCQVDKDRTIKIKGNYTATINKDSKIIIDGKSTTSVEKDYTLSVSGKANETVDKDYTLSISGDAKTTVDKEYKLQVTKDASWSVDGKSKVQIKDDSETKLEKNMKLAVTKEAQISVDKNMQVKVSKEMTLKADKTLTLKCGSASIILKKDGKITIKGSDINVKGSGKVKVKGSKIGNN